MKIFLPFTVRDTGGTSTFAKKFKAGLEARGHNVFFDFQEDYDVLFVVVQCHPRYLHHAKKNRRKIVQRLDGLYYWSVATWKFPLLNFPPFLIRRFYADVVIYQSQYSRCCAERFLGRSINGTSTIIYNGVSTSLFTPEGKRMLQRDNQTQRMFLTASQFRRTDQILPLLQALTYYKKHFTDNFKFFIIGDFSREVKELPRRYRGLPQVHFLGKVRNEDLSAYERSADAFLMTHLNPPCPNNILEAMASGLPICGVADGAMPEITEPGKNALLLPAEGNAFWQRRTYDIQQFARNLETLTQNRETFGIASRQLAESRFSLDHMLDNYLAVLEAL